MNGKGKPMDDLIRRFRDYQIEWLTSHNDIEFCEEEEKLIIGFLKDTAESFMRENQTAQHKPFCYLDSPCPYQNEEIKVTKKKGQWKSKWYNLFYYCSECANPSACKSNFCPDCGADMREDGYCSFGERETDE